MKKMLEEFSQYVHPYWVILAGTLLSFLGAWMMQLKTEFEARKAEEKVTANHNSIINELSGGDSYIYVRPYIKNEKLYLQPILVGKNPLKAVNVQITDYALYLHLNSLRNKKIDAMLVPHDLLDTCVHLEKIDLITPTASPFPFKYPISRDFDSLLFACEVFATNGNTSQRIEVKDLKTKPLIFECTVYKDNKVIMKQNF